jgi:hypothetical protein
MSYLRWSATILAFPIGGWIASLIMGAPTGIVTAGLAALIAGTVLGAVQWWALASHVSWQWVVATAAGFAVGSTASFALFEGSIAVVPLSLAGLITGSFIGVAQGLLLRRGWRTVALWTASTGLSWAVGWAISLLVISSNASGYIVFGLSGAAVVTLVTGLTLHRILGPARPARTATAIVAGPSASLR